MAANEQTRSGHANLIYLVRHGENRANITKEFSHRNVDYSLTPKGVLQSEQTAEYFKLRQLDSIYSSPMKRAVETAKIIADAKGLPVLIADAFREVDAGDLEGKPPTAENWQLYMNIVRGWYEGKQGEAFPGGENYYQLAARIRHGMAEAVEGREGSSIAIVGHGGIFTAAIIELCCNVTPGDLRSVDYNNCAISELSLKWQDGELVGELLLFGYSGHLSGEAAQLVSAIPDGVTDSGDAVNAAYAAEE